MFGTLEPDIYFYGETIEKIGEDRYRITQRRLHDLRAADAALGDRHRHSHDQSRGLRHPAQRRHPREGRAGLLPADPLLPDSERRPRHRDSCCRPTAARRYRGQSLSNAFFWAINRSQDLTLLHDWFTKTGQGAGAEYRYVGARRARKAFPQPTGCSEKRRRSRQPAAARRSRRRAAATRSRGDASQALPAGIRARARVDYFSDLTTQQLYNTNIYEASQRQRTIDGSVTGAWGGVSATGNFQRSELFRHRPIRSSTATRPRSRPTSRASGSACCRSTSRSTAKRATSSTRTTRVAAEIDLGLGRFDATPTFRAALSNWPFLNVNGTAPIGTPTSARASTTSGGPGAGSV